jgi:hypothetical protein
MNYNNDLRLRIGIVIPLFTLLVASCGLSDEHPPDQWWIVDAPAQPDNINQDGETWAARVDGDGRWRYFPQQVSTYMDRMAPDRCGPIDTATLTIAGKQWTLEVASNNTWTITPPWTLPSPPQNSDQYFHTPANSRSSDKSDSPESEVGIVVAIFAGVFAVLIAIPIAHHVGHREGEERSHEAAYVEALRRLNTKEEQLHQREEQLQIVDAASLKLRKELEKEKTRLQAKDKEIDEKCRGGMQAIQLAQSMLKTSPPKNEPAAVSKYLRDHHLHGSGCGELITASYLADRTGFICLAWSVQTDRPLPPQVRIRRNNSLIRRDFSLVGEHRDQIIPGQRYVYQFEVYDDRGEELGKSLLMEVKIPLAKSWDGIVPVESGDPYQQIREKFKSRYGGLKVVEELRQAFHTEVNSQNYSEDVSGWLLSQIDAMAGEIRGEAGN